MSLIWNPFPGMDPYLEDPSLWADFHQRLARHLSECLVSVLQEARYTVGTGQRRYAEQEEMYVLVKRVADDDLVTLVDIVSPANKTTAAGREAYLETRTYAKDSEANIVEIDLVLQGRPTLDYSREGLPMWHYAVTVTRATLPERFEIYTATLCKRLPRFRLPLGGDDRDVVLDLPVLFARCYDEGDYGSQIDYHTDPPGPLNDEYRHWLDCVLTGQGHRDPPPAQVAVAAYHLWEREGRPHGRDKEHWQRALEQLRSEKRAEAAKSGPAPGK